MNNKGQTLILFVMLLPLLFILLCLVIDFGLLYSEKVKMENVVKESIRNELNCTDCVIEDSKNRIKTIINKNVDNVKIDNISIENDIISILISKEYKGIFSVILNKKNYNLVVSYKGYKINDKIIIKKE